MQLSTLFRMLIGNRQSIVAIAGCRNSLWLGALFVLSAGFAREYDGEDLFHEPWHLLLPLLASLVTSFVLFSILYLAIRQHSATPVAFLPSYRRFLSLYWMTAPLAWLYAIPVEHFMTAGDAVQTNLWLLGIVSVWRVLLISRCSSVLFGSSFTASFILVMLFADTLALIILFLTPLPVFNIMGGIRLSESEAIIQSTALAVQFFGLATWLIWFIAGSVICGMEKRHWHPVQFEMETSNSVSKPLWTMGILALLVWPFVLPRSQPPQQLRRAVEEDLENGRIEQALQMMSKHDRESFPPHWDPPPRPGYGEHSPPLIRVLEYVTEQPVSDWVRDIYLDKLTSQMENSFGYDSLNWIGDDEFGAYMDMFENSVETREIVKSKSTAFTRYLEYGVDRTEIRKPQIRSLLETLGVDIPIANSPDSSDSPEEVNKAVDPTP